MTGWDRARRDAEIVAERAQGRSWASIASTAGVSPRHARRVVAGYRDSGVLLDRLDPVDLVETAYNRYETAIVELEEISETAQNESAAVGAVKARIDIVRAEIDLLQGLGVLPRNLAAVRADGDMRMIVSEILRLFDKYALPVEAEKELLETAGQWRPRVN